MITGDHTDTNVLVKETGQKPDKMIIHISPIIVKNYLRKKPH